MEPTLCSRRSSWNVDRRQRLHRTRPHFQFSQCAHDCVAPSFQPVRRSNSAMSTNQRWLAALMWPESVKISFARSSMECMSESVRSSTVDAYSIRCELEECIANICKVVRRCALASAWGQSTNATAPTDAPSLTSQRPHRIPPVSASSSTSCAKLRALMFRNRKPSFNQALFGQESRTIEHSRLGARSLPSPHRPRRTQ